MNRILILGASGHFGKKIAEALTKENFPLILAGRSTAKIEMLYRELEQKYPGCDLICSVFDVFESLDEKLKELNPKIVIHTCGPFQCQNYQIPKLCIENKVHYIDLSDARDFVRDITQLNTEALTNKVTVISGASSLPGLSSAVIEEFKPLFSEFESLEFGINSGQNTPGGLATTEAILSYTGKKIPTYPGAQGTIIGWQGLHRVTLPECGKRWMSYCSVPDLDLLPQAYGFKSIGFYGGVESSFLHLSLWIISWFIRWGLPINLTHFSSLFYRVAKSFERYTSDVGGMYFFIRGKDLKGQEKTAKWYLIAKENHGLYIPTAAALVLAKKIHRNQFNIHGAMACVGLVSLKEILDQLAEFEIKTFVED